MKGKGIGRGIVDWDNSDTNMYGCYPCPKCRSKFRASYQKKDSPGTIECDDCGFIELILEVKQ